MVGERVQVQVRSGSKGAGRGGTAWLWHAVSPRPAPWEVITHLVLQEAVLARARAVEPPAADRHLG